MFDAIHDIQMQFAIARCNWVQSSPPQAANSTIHRQLLIKWRISTHQWLICVNMVILIALMILLVNCNAIHDIQMQFAVARCVWVQLSPPQAANSIIHRQLLSKWRISAQQWLIAVQIAILIALIIPLVMFDVIHDIQMRFAVARCYRPRLVRNINVAANGNINVAANCMLLQIFDFCKCKSILYIGP